MLKRAFLTFDDISVPDPSVLRSLEDEEWRAYTFSADEIVVIENPVALTVSQSGGHYIYLRNGNVAYIPVGWISLEWRPRSTANYHRAF